MPQGPPTPDTYANDDPRHDEESFLWADLRYPGDPKQYRHEHQKTYGREEGLAEHGVHSPRQKHGFFPEGSDRQRMYANYSRTTQPMNDAHAAYRAERALAEEEFQGFRRPQQEYYNDRTGSMSPDQHERLLPKAQNWQDLGYDNARGREDMVKYHPVGYHLHEQALAHHDGAAKVYHQYGEARDRVTEHDTHRCLPNENRKDQWDRPVPRHFTEGDDGYSLRGRDRRR